jgi:hypothetical protein
MRRQSPAEYEERIASYRMFIEKVSGSSDSGVITPVPENTNYTSGGRILAAWANAVTGGVGCWTTAWTPTELNMAKDEEV